jgi:hypothetical protein
MVIYAPQLETIGMEVIDDYFGPHPILLGHTESLFLPFSLTRPPLSMRQSSSGHSRYRRRPRPMCYGPNDHGLLDHRYGEKKEGGAGAIWISK